MVVASRTPETREPMFVELAKLARVQNVRDRQPSRPRERTLLTVFEEHREQLLPLLTEQRETETAGAAMVKLMLGSTMFGRDRNESVVWVAGRVPADVSTKIETELDYGRIVGWERIAFNAMTRWKDERLTKAAPRAPRTLADLDATSEIYIKMFNRLHGLEPPYRALLMKGMGPVEVFNAVVGGEIELYRLGTSSYRAHLHREIIRGIREARSYEAFLVRATPRSFPDVTATTMTRRGLVFVRIAASFGLLDTVLEHVRDRDNFIETVLAAVGEPQHFEANSALIVDVATSQSTSNKVAGFKRQLIDRLHARYLATTDASLKRVYGSMLSVYQTISGETLEASVSRQFPLDTSMFQVPSERLFTADRRTGPVHRMFMRMNDDLDAVSTYAAFRPFMARLGASLQSSATYDVYRITRQGRTVEIYANKPTAAGMTAGITQIQHQLQGKRIDTLIGRGHTSIVEGFKADSKRLLAHQSTPPTAVMVGVCGGDASVRSLIRTFGHVAFFTTKATGRKVINNALMESYINALFAAAPGKTVSMQAVVDRAVTPFLKRKGDAEMREDARLYHVNRSTVLTSRLLASSLIRE
jgi:hypothetical protein